MKKLLTRTTDAKPYQTPNLLHFCCNSLGNDQVTVGNR